MTITGTEIFPKTFWERTLEKSLCIGLVARTGNFAFKDLSCILGHFLCQVPNKEQFLDTDRKFQTSGNRTEKNINFSFSPWLAMPAWFWHVGLWLCSAAGFGQVAIRQMSLLQSHHSTWQPGWRLFAAIHEAGFVLLVGDAVKYKGRN